MASLIDIGYESERRLAIVNLGNLRPFNPEVDFLRRQGFTRRPQLPKPEGGNPPIPCECYIRADIQNVGLDDNPQYVLLFDGRPFISYFQKEYDLFEFSVPVAACNVYPRVIQSRLEPLVPG
jgi:hypothetical protein